MIQTNCSKCDGELILHDGYGVCSKCGEIIGFDVEEEAEETAEEILIPPQPAEEEIIAEEVKEPEVLEEISEIVPKTEESGIEETEEVTVVEEEPEELEEAKDEVIINEEAETPKKKKSPIVVLVIAVLCILALLGGYFITKVNQGIVDNDTENVIPEEDVIEEEPKAIDEEPEETQIQQEPEKEEIAPEQKPGPVKQDTPKKQTVKKEDAVISPTPSISYRIRKSADDSDTQIGAFSDIERAKAFASSHAAEGYKVYDMNGNIVFEP